MKNIKVSVLIYVRNDIKHIEKCIQSVRNQTLQDIEILIIDGGSTDGTRELIGKLSMQDPRMRIIDSLPGVGLQFNRGLREAEGEYIGICESDDYILPGMYGEQYDIVKKHRLDILKADFNRFCGLGDGETFFPVAIMGNPGLYNCVICPDEDMGVMKAGSQGFWSGLYRRDFLLGQGIFMNETPGASYQDMGFSFLAMIKAKRVMFMKKAFYCYRMDNPGSSENSPRKLAMVMEEYNLLKDRLQGENLFEAYKEWYLSWKAGAMLWFYNRLFGEAQREYAVLMYQDIRNERISTKYTGDELSAECKEIVDQTEVPLEAFQEFLQKKSGELYRMERMMESIREGQEILIFGSGNMGKLVRSYMEQIGKTVTAYMDNNKELWGKTESRLLIMDPEQAAALYPDAVYIIANASAYEEIRRQLLNHHIAEDKIIICRNYERILSRLQKKIIIKAANEVSA